MNRSPSSMLAVSNPTAPPAQHGAYGVRAILRWEGGRASVTNPGKLYPVPNCSDPQRAEA